MQWAMPPVLHAGAWAMLCLIFHLLHVDYEHEDEDDSYLEPDSPGPMKLEGR